MKKKKLNKALQIILYKEQKKTKLIKRYLFDNLIILLKKY